MINLQLQTVTGDDRMGTVLKGVEPKGINLEDGVHQGKIKVVEVRKVDGKSYSYLDVYIALDNKVDDKELELRVGFPVGDDPTISAGTALGLLVERFTGEEVKPDGSNLLNLKPLNPGSMKHIVNSQGMLTGYKQRNIFG